ncbi:MAG: P1 family peptidase [Bacillota bacterium]
MTQAARAKPRARDLGIPFEGRPGELNAITDVAGVEVGLATLIEGDAVRTGVTAILPRGKRSGDPVFAGWFSLNGNGEMTGTAWIDEAGFLEGPVLITNTHSVGTVRDASIRWALERGQRVQPWALPVVAETYDGGLNDIDGFHVKPEHVFAALDDARSGPVPEGNVGGGTGMRCYGFKGGTGTASRKVGEGSNEFTVGVLVQANHGLQRLLRIAGLPVGLELEAEDESRRRSAQALSKSIIIVVATDAPLLPHQLKRVAKRASLGLARSGAISAHTSGDIFIAFSTANPEAASAKDRAQVDMLSNERITALFEATIQATDEAIVNALIAAETMTGFKGATVSAIPHDRVVEILARHGQLQDG